MDLTDIHAEMANECGDAQERIAMEEVELDPLRTPFQGVLTPWEQDFMETMRKARKYGWTLSSKQVSILDRIRAAEEEAEEMALMAESMLPWDFDYEDDPQGYHARQEEEATAHMTEEEIERFYAYMEEVSHPDVAGGAYGNVRRFRGKCPTWYDSSGYSNGRGYQVYWSPY